ncbi:Erj5p [Nakaseomyces bracarensis]|uniref:Erj5p n=1 Tax=Nakaseomyces bracarensis TaxID=273131 RepID=UPI003871E7EC
MLRYKSLVVLACLVGLVYCFTKEEVEMFQLQKEIVDKYGGKVSDGSSIDFYKFLRLPEGQKSTTKQITKNLRKLSRKYHPDKNPKYRKLYERLNVATKILANESLRKTYDYYLKNGFPDYDFNKGGFFFQRVKPATWFLVLFVFLAASFMHLVIMKLQYKSNVRRITSFIQQCKAQDDTDGLGEKRLFFKQHEEDPGKELVLRFGDVYVVEEDGSESLISADTITKPTIFDALIFRLPLSAWNRTFGKLLPERKPTDEAGKNNAGGITLAEAVAKDNEKEKKNKSVQPKSGQKKMTLPNGKVIYSRKTE